MTVVIQDLEVIAEPPAEAPVPETPAEAAVPPPALLPQDVDEILRRRAARRARLRAH